jgi:hypothetical protein
VPLYAKTARLASLARQHAVGLISDARLNFHLRWSRWRRRHQARARWRHYSALWVPKTYATRRYS